MLEKIYMLNVFTHLQNNDILLGVNMDGKKWFEINGFLLLDYLIVPRLENNMKGNELYGRKMFFAFLVHCSLHWPHYNHQSHIQKQQGLLSQPHFEGSVRSPFTLPKMGLGSPSGLPKTQSAIAKVKTPHIEALFILLERSWSVDVQNGLAWAILTSAAQVMVERRAGSQTGSLTPDH